MEFQRETATRIEDLPHQFTGIQRAKICEVCTGAREDPRHGEWEKQAIATREHANNSLFEREFGS